LAFAIGIAGTTVWQWVDKESAKDRLVDFTENTCSPNMNRSRIAAGGVMTSMTDGTEGEYLFEPLITGQV
jgi:hypothetical protein